MWLKDAQMIRARSQNFALDGPDGPSKDPHVFRFEFSLSSGSSAVGCGILIKNKLANLEFGRAEIDQEAVRKP